MKDSSTKQPTKFRSFDVVCYDDPGTLISHFHNLLHYAYILHNHDVKEDTGEIKEAHYHLILCFVNPRSIEGLKAELLRYATQNIFVQPVKHSVGASYLYLMHKTKKAINDGKLPYDEREIISDDIGFWSKKGQEFCEDTENSFSNEKFLLDLFRYNELQMAIVYGRDYIKNVTKYNAFKDTVHGLYNLKDCRIEYHINIAIENLM